MALWFYGDESGMEENPPWCIVSGYIGSPRQWDVVRTEWSAVLSKYEVPELHAVYLFHRHSKRSNNPYRFWSAAKADAFLGELASIIRKYQRNKRITPFGAGVDVKAFRSLSIGEQRFLTGGKVKKRDGLAERWVSNGSPRRPYLLALQWVIKAVLESVAAGTKVHFVLDRQNVVEGAAKIIVQGMKKESTHTLYAKLGMISYEDSVEQPAIQLGDLRSHLWYRYAYLGTAMGVQQLAAMTAITHGIDEIWTVNAGELENILNVVDGNEGPGFRDWLRAEGSAPFRSGPSRVSA